METPSALTITPVRFRNYYDCSECGDVWSDVWTCQCNDKCPTCGAEVEPTASEDITPVGYRGKT